MKSEHQTEVRSAQNVCKVRISRRNVQTLFGSILEHFFHGLQTFKFVCFSFMFHFFVVCFFLESVGFVFWVCVNHLLGTLRFSFGSVEHNFYRWRPYFFSLWRLGDYFSGPKRQIWRTPQNHFHEPQRSFLSTQRHFLQT